MSRSISIKRFTPAFIAAIDEAGRKVFGYRPVVQHRTGFKLFKRRPIGPISINHYLPDYTRPFRDMTNDFNTEIEERRAEKLYNLKRRGKGPPKKGKGKRALKKK